jgi:hypothetical protein
MNRNTYNMRDSHEILDLRNIKKQGLFSSAFPKVLGLFTLYALAFYGLASLVPDGSFRSLDKWASVEENQVKIALWVFIIGTLAVLSYLIFLRKK